MPSWKADWPVYREKPFGLLAHRRPDCVQFKSFSKPLHSITIRGAYSTAPPQISDESMIVIPTHPDGERRLYSSVCRDRPDRS